MLKLSSRLVQAVFWACVLATIFLSLVPVELLPQACNWWDKAQHALGFAVVTTLGLPAYPKADWRLPCGLFGRRQPGSPVQRHSSWPVGRDECRCLVDQG